MTKERIFGTDGVRGVANKQLNASLALRMGMAAGAWAHESALPGTRPTVIIGRDTRISGDMLEAALAAGLASMGADVLSVGVVPTPAVAQIVLALGAAAGIVISASHNPFEDNGIKFFGSDGHKLPDSVEDRIESLMRRCETLPRPVGGNVGRVSASRVPVEEYVRRVEATVGGPEARALEGLTLVMDTAEGAAFALAPRIFEQLGAKVHLIHAQPDGVNINVKCGSTKPQEMAAAVVALGANAGLAFDGDADRVMLADERGNIIDGDRMMAIIALHLKEQGRLPGDTVVATIMSNVGLEQALCARGVKLHRTDVGDRYVAEAMEKMGAAVGGEQSGHILLPGLTPTGDGLVTALQVLTVMRERAVPLSELASVVVSGPQLLKNVRVKSKAGWQEDADILQAIAAGGAKLGNPLWLSVRASGTEPLIRVMAQGLDQQTVEEVVHAICAVVELKLVQEAN